jgi:hypothetical protein
MQMSRSLPFLVVDLPSQWSVPNIAECFENESSCRVFPPRVAYGHSDGCGKEDVRITYDLISSYQILKLTISDKKLFHAVLGR